MSALEAIIKDQDKRTAKKRTEEELRYLSKKGDWIFISDIIIPLQEKGISLDTKIRKQRSTILTKYVRFENQTQIISQMKDRLILLP